MTTYVIAVKRDQRSKLSLTHALNQIREIDDLRVLDEDNPHMARIEASERAIDQVRDRISWGCHIEAGIAHTPQVHTT